MPAVQRSRARRPPPLLRDDRLSLEQLGRMAREFDQISRADGRDWPAVRFVEWLAAEYWASRDREPVEGMDEAAQTRTAPFAAMTRGRGSP